MNTKLAVEIEELLLRRDALGYFIKGLDILDILGEENALEEIQKNKDQIEMINSLIKHMRDDKK